MKNVNKKIQSKNHDQKGARYVKMLRYHDKVKPRYNLRL